MKTKYCVWLSFNTRCYTQRLTSGMYNASLYLCTWEIAGYPDVPVTEGSSA
ncbi:unnamed protein product, partial [Brassica oleracea var. botrytis]